MALFRRRRRDPIKDAWEEMAARLQLVQAVDSRETLVDLLALEDSARLGPLHRAPAAGELDVYVFTHEAGTDPRTREPLTATCALVLARKPSSVAPMRVARRMPDLIASLQASGSGGEVVRFADPVFEAEVTVIARHPQVVVPLLTPSVRQLLLKVIRRGEAVNVTVGEGRILVSSHAGGPQPELTEFLLSDALTLYAVLLAPRA